MRALLVHPKSPESFWTFDQGLAILGKKSLVAPLGLMTVAALLPRSWELRLVDRSCADIDAALWNWCDIVMVSAMLVQKEDVMEVIQAAKQNGKKVIVGGPFASSMPKALIESGADFVFQGEAETGLEELIAAVTNGNPTGVFSEHGKPDLSASPMPRFDLLDMGSYTCMPVQTSRGCPFNCEFCDVIKLYGRKPRYKSADQVIEEMTSLYALGWNGTVFLSDDNFIGSKTHARDILRALTPWNRSRGQPFCFWTQASVDLGNDREMIDLMTAANFGHIFLGIETPDESVLIANRKHQNVRNPLVEAVRTINANGLSIIGSFILGFDGEIKGAGERICEFVEQTHIPEVMLNLLQAPPNTALWDRLERENRLLKDKTDGGATAGGFNFIPTRPANEILQEYLDMVERLYEPGAYLKRAYQYYLNMRPTRRALAGKTAKHYPSNECAPEFARTSHLKNKRLRPALSLLWRQGMASSHRFRFWKQLLGMLRKNPSRLISYLNALGFGENCFHFRDTVRERIGAMKSE